MELLVQQRLTRAFIRTRPSVVSLIPRSRATTPTGGFVWVEGDPRPEQIVRLSEVTGGGPQVTLDGVQRELSYELVALHDAELALHDVWDDGAATWEIVDVRPHNGWEIRASVARFGGGA